jgi:hypothetical protein
MSHEEDDADEGLAGGAVAAAILVAIGTAQGILIGWLIWG